MTLKLSFIDSRLGGTRSTLIWLPGSGSISSQKLDPDAESSSRQRGSESLPYCVLSYWKSKTSRNWISLQYKKYWEKIKNKFLFILAVCRSRQNHLNRTEIFSSKTLRSILRARKVRRSFPPITPSLGMDSKGNIQVYWTNIFLQSYCSSNHTLYPIRAGFPLSSVMRKEHIFQRKKFKKFTIYSRTVLWRRSFKYISFTFIVRVSLWRQ
jgi:hypothetical protein